jgi:peroxin-5
LLQQINDDKVLQQRQTPLPPAQIMFQSMMSGAECSTGSTPLASLLKQQNTDHSLHQPGFSGQQVGAGPSFRSSPGLSGRQLEEAERFFQQGSGPVTPKNGGSQMGMENLRRELERVARNDNQGSMKGDRGQLNFCHSLLL